MENTTKNDFMHEFSHEAKSYVKPRIIFLQVFHTWTVAAFPKQPTLKKGRGLLPAPEDKVFSRQVCCVFVDTRSESLHISLILLQSFVFFGFGHFQPSAPFCALAVRRLHALKLAGTRFATLWIGLTQDHIGPCIRLTDISDQEWRSVTVVRFGKAVSVYHQTVKSTQVIAVAFHWGTCTDPL